MSKRILDGLILAGLLIPFAGLLIFDLVNSAFALWSSYQGGTRLEYKLDLSHVAEDPLRVTEDARRILTERLDAYGLRTATVLAKGPGLLEIYAPGWRSDSVGAVKRLTERAGVLSFQLVIDDEALTSPEKIQAYVAEEKAYRESHRVWAAKKRAWLARQAQAAAAGQPFAEPPPQQPAAPEYIVRSLGEWVEDETGGFRFEPKAKGERVLGNTESRKIEGGLLSYVSATTDANLNPAVGFGFGREGAHRFGELTGNHIGQPLAILLDADILQVANIKSRISTNGILEGRFTRDEVRETVTMLRSGSLPARPVLQSKNAVPSIPFRPRISWNAYLILGAPALLIVSVILWRRKKRRSPAPAELEG